MPTPNALLTGALSALALLGASPAAQAAEPDLLARWALDTVGTTTPNAVDARLDGKSVTGTPVAGRFGSALSLTNTPATQGFFADDATPLVEPSSVTVMAWVKRNAAPTTWAPIVAKSGVGRSDVGQGECELSAFSLVSGGEYGPHFEITAPATNPGDLAISMSASVPATQVWDGKWHAIAGSFDAASRTMTIALDGKIVGTTKVDGTSIAYGSFPKRSVAVGRYPDPSCDDGPGRGFDGSIDDVRVYGRALTATEVAFLQDPAATAPPELPVDKPSAPAPEQQQPAPPTTNEPGPAAVPAAPLRLLPLPGGSLTIGSTPKPPKPVLPKPPLQAALAKTAKSLNDLLKAPKPASQVFTERPKLSKKERNKLKPSRSLDEVLDELLRGLPIRVKVPGAAQYAQVAAALTIRRKAPNGKVEINTVALPPVVLPVKNGLAVGRLTIDPIAAAVLRKSGAIDAAIGIVAIAIDGLPNAKPGEQVSIDQKLAKQNELEQQLAKQIDAFKQAEKTLDKFAKLADKAKGTTEQKKAASKEAQAKEKLDDADATATQTADDLAKMQAEALKEMMRQIIEFVRKMQEQSPVVDRLTRI